MDPIYYLTGLTKKSLLSIGMSMLLFACAGQQTKPPAETIPPNDPEANVKEAIRFLKQDNPERALNTVLQTLEKDPNNVEAYNVAGLVYQKYAQPELADKYFRRALDLEPQSANIRNNYGIFLCAGQEYEKAEENFLIAATSQHPHATEVSYTNAGLCALRVPDLDRAAQYFRAALEANPRLAIPYYQLAYINFEKKRYPQARRSLQSYLNYAMHNSKSLWLGIQIEKALGDKQKENQYSQMLQQKFPDSKEARKLLLQFP
jgi:type IV pilus assembly protein PilF